MLLGSSAVLHTPIMCVGVPRQRGAGPAHARVRAHDDSAEARRGAVPDLSPRPQISYFESDTLLSLLPSMSASCAAVTRKMAFLLGSCSSPLMSSSSRMW